MPDVGKPQVVVIATLIPNATVTSAIAEVGGRGEAVEMLAVHYTWESLVVVGGSFVAAALSTNPEHELNPPTTKDTLLANKALYGLDFEELNITTSGGQHIQTKIIPLYGVIRPRRQIIMFLAQIVPTTITVRAEIYYRPVSLNKDELDTLNLKYGKYRRHA